MKDMLNDEIDAAIVHATIELAHNLDLSVVAEGVENRETMDNLQDYFISKPPPSEEFPVWPAG